MLLRCMAITSVHHYSDSDRSGHRNKDVRTQDVGRTVRAMHQMPKAQGKRPTREDTM